MSTNEFDELDEMIEQTDMSLDEINEEIRQTRIARKTTKPVLQ